MAKKSSKPTPAKANEVADDKASATEAVQDNAAAGTPPASAPAPGADAAAISAAVTSAISAGTEKPDLTVPTAEGDDVALVVIGPKKGLWRAGRHFTSEPTVIAVSDLTETEAEMLRDEPKLAISVVPLPVPTE